MDDALYHAIVLWRLLEQSTSAFRKLSCHWPDPAAALAAGVQAWAQAGLSERAQQALVAWQRGHDLPVLRAVEHVQSLMVAEHWQVLTLTDVRYPLLLREISDPPPLLFCRGEVANLVWPQVAIVGSRRPTRQGLAMAAEFAAGLAARGLAVTSGLAQGIDGAAHHAALEAGGLTLAVLGTGLQQVYPAQHRELAQRIVDSDGLLLSEFLPDTPPIAYHFPRRNRIISGLSLGVLVVEAALQSGSLITARQALEQNREVWAMPGAVSNPQARGCHALIREGARLVEEAAQILEDVAPRLGRLQQAVPVPRVPEQLSVLPVSAQAEQLLQVLGWQVRDFDNLSVLSGWPVATVASLLTELELAGRIATVAGGFEQLKS